MTILVDRPQGLVLRVGNRLAENYRCRLVARASGAHSEAVFTVDKWLESDGVPTRGEYLDRLRADVVAAVRRVDPQAHAEDLPLT